jgi:hypothetical protein
MKGLTVKKLLIAETIVLMLSLLDCARIHSQTPLAPPLPPGTTYYKGPIVAQGGVGVIGCTNEQFIKGDASGCANAPSSVPASCAMITDAPYNAACDGTTDDSAAIQSAMDNNSCIKLPISTASNVQQCNFASTLIENNNNLNIILNGSVLDYTGTTTGIKGLQNSQQFLQIQNGYFDLTSSSGTPSFLDVDEFRVVSLINLVDYGDGPTGYNSIYSNSGLLNLSVFDSVFGGNCYIEGAIYLYFLDSACGANSTLNSGNMTLIGSLFLNTTITGGGSPYEGVNLNGSYFNNLVISGEYFVNGTVAIKNSISVSGTYNGLLCNDLNSTCVNYGLLQPGLIYNATSNPLPVCGSGLGNTWVSDATNLTGLYIGHGSYNAPVYCDGTNWQMSSPTQSTHNLVASWAGNSCTFTTDGNSGEGCTATQSWGTTISGTYYFSCSSGPFSAGTIAAAGGFIVNPYSSTPTTSTQFTYVIDNRTELGAIGNTIPMQCFAWE